MGNDSKITLGADSIAKYKQFGENVLKESKATLKKSGITVPLGQGEKDADAPIKGLTIEHVDTPYDEPAEVPTEAPTEILSETLAEEPTEPSAGPESQKQDNKSETEKNHKISVNNYSFTDSKSSLSNTYNALVSQNSAFSNKDNLSGIEMSNHDALNNLIDVMDDIDDAGQRHIDDLTKKYPDYGHLSGEVYASYEKNNLNKTTIFQGNINNSWQNKSKTFVITGSASFGYEKTKTSDVVNDNVKFDGDDSDIESAAARIKTRNVEDDNQDSQNTDDISQSLKQTDKSGNFSLNMRLNKKKYVYGVGINSNFSSDGVQIHDQNVSVMHKSSGLAGDLTRRTTVTKDELTGETIVRSQNKLKISIVSRNEDSENPFAVDSEDKTTEENNIAEENDIQEEDNYQVSSEKVIKKDSVNPEIKKLESEIQQDAEELKGKIKDGSGFNIDFEYNDSNCGVLTQYGIHLIDKPQEQTRLTIAPVLGVYDHTPAEEEDAESLRLTVGSVAEFKKYYKNGNKIEADLCVTANRIATQGCKPSDTKYAVFNGSFINPRKKFSVGLNAGTISNSEMSVKYAELNASLRAKHSTWGLQAGVTNYDLNSIGVSDTNYIIGAKCTFDLNYKTKK